MVFSMTKIHRYSGLQNNILLDNMAQEIIPDKQSVLTLPCPTYGISCVCGKRSQLTPCM